MLVVLTAVFAAVWFASRTHGWLFSGPLLLMFALLPLINVPFDWFALGLTRALLRRGLAPGGLGPFAYALIDALVSPLLILLLALVCVVLTQAFDDLAVLRAGTDRVWIFPLGQLFQGLNDRPDAVEFLWVWFMLFSTMIPSLLNLLVAAAAFMRGSPQANAWLLRRIPADGSPMPETDRFLVAMVLAGQIAGGAFLAGLSLYGLGRWLLPLFLPEIGTIIRGVAEWVAALDLPARLVDFLGPR